MRIMGLDYGARTVGVALSDPMMVTAQPKEIIRRERENALRKTLKRIGDLAESEDVGLIVIGLPRNMDDTEGERAAAARDFADWVERRTGVPVVLQDERLTTVEAEEIMKESGIRDADYKKYIDQVAAKVILEDYMSSHPEETAAFARGEKPVI